MNTVMTPERRCTCGLPLHYSDPAIERMVNELVERLGPNIHVTTDEGTWIVPRHYIALHGISAQELAMSKFEKVR